MLYLIATPIGNLGDITLRALETLRELDLLLAEDTRHSRKLLDHYDLHPKLSSFHEFSSPEKIEAIVRELASGKKIGLISDAGHPALSDPGAILVKKAREAGVCVTIIPGASALASAISLSGRDGPFHFFSFAPKEDLEGFLANLLATPGTSLFFQSPERIEKTLEILEKIAPDRPLALARELTKMHEEWLEGMPKELLKKSSSFRGEFVVLIDGKSPESSADPLIEFLRANYKLSPSKIMSIAAAISSQSKRELYKNYLQPKESKS